MSRVAFFDVDGTLLNLRSMESFYQFYIDSHLSSEIEKQRARSVFQHFSSAVKTTSREVLNRMYYRLYRDVNYISLSALAVDWYKQVGSLCWIDSVIERLRRHQELSDYVVLVSGSGDFILKPIVDALNVDDCLCSTPEVKQRICTGELINSPVIGARKMQVAQQWMTKKGIYSSHSVAYGDHISDSDLLKFAHQAVAVNPDDSLTHIARQYNWEIIRSPNSNSLNQ